MEISASIITYRVIASRGLNVREGPDISHPRIGALRFNEIVHKYDANQQETWFRIKNLDGTLTGWCSAKFLVLQRKSDYIIDAEYPDIKTLHITYPAKGVTRLEGNAYGTRFYLSIFKTDQISIEVVHELNRPSSVAKKRGATFAYNGDDWNRSTRQVKGMEICNGVKFQRRLRGEPSLITTKNGQVFIDHQDIPDQWNVTSGLRYIVKNRANQIPSNRSEPKYTEKHARSARGLHADGRVMFLTVDGDYVYNGLTLWETAQTLIHFGCDVAYDGGGGGDSVEVMNGIVKNIPDDEDQNGNPHERVVPQTILVFADLTVDENNIETKKFATPI